MALLFGFFFRAASILLGKGNGWEDFPFAVAGRVAASDVEFSASERRVAGRVATSDSDTELVGVGGIPPASAEKLALIYLNFYLCRWM